jgi:hypothetical protein
VKEVLLGKNRFIDCDSILAYKGQIVLRVRFEPLRVNLVTPEGLPSGRAVHVDDKAIRPRQSVKIVETSNSFAVFWNESALVLATLLSEDTAHLKLDLRPLGMLIYDDVDGLHIGQNRFTGNVVTRAAAAINLAD